MFQLTQEGRQHLGRLSFGVGEKHDPASNLVDTDEDPGVIPAPASWTPNHSPHVRPEHHEAALIQVGEKGPV